MLRTRAAPVRYVVWGPTRGSSMSSWEAKRGHTLANSLIIRRVEALACSVWCIMLAEVSGAGLHSVPDDPFCLLVSYRPLASLCRGNFVGRAVACTHGGIELKAYDYFARVVLWLWVDLHERNPGQRLLKPLCCSTQPKTSLCAAH